MVSIHMIQSTLPDICQTNHFLDTLKWVEDSIQCRSPNVSGIPLSPVFSAPQDPYPHNVIHTSLELYEFATPWSHPKYSHPNPKNTFKNRNKQFRKMGHLKQPGGASCDQRR